MRVRQALSTLAFLALWRGAAADVLSDIESALESAVDCGGCHALLVPLQALAHLGNDNFVNTIVTICETFKVRPPPYLQARAHGR